jgi:hypothetical protein
MLIGKIRHHGFAEEKMNQEDFINGVLFVVGITSLILFMILIVCSS